MAKDDYFVLVYGLLKYLYEQLKKGEKPESQKLSLVSNNVRNFVS